MATPSTSTRSRSTSTRRPSSATSPSTVTRPSAIRSSHTRREPRPTRAGPPPLRRSAPPPPAASRGPPAPAPSAGARRRAGGRRDRPSRAAAGAQRLVERLHDVGARDELGDGGQLLQRVQPEALEER